MDVIGKKGVITIRAARGEGRYGEPQEGLVREVHILI